ncbi:MAG: UDP-N-acetylmuramoyl-L-alanyl-D-glutamate--2,6-diaminopimelate ligase [Proteobacteria bacterium]|nr:UDP-N-acetylmuramoyl-L-alanyl-D-glutamate--2,6-diaminopimelate ligase [Pseudomonadota bacterium]MCL2307175.1 UDP-N-acetylmuramoyl-L-alanyl-D-glutamate--2,6-diaminopimelate ligase [Pseudomonadota bacterium]
MLHTPFSPAFSLGALTAWLTQFPTLPKGITIDSRQITPGMLFAALPGTKHDGRRFIAEAIARGAVGILQEVGDGNGGGKAETITVPRWDISGLAPCLGIIADAVYGQPSWHLPLIGVTGTNGKTSCAHWIAQALQARGTRTGVIGTLGHGLVEEKAWSPSLNTTPDAASLQSVLAQLRQQGAQAIVMEVSSIGLEQGRVNGCRFDTALFTNLTRDHLDYHGTFEAYAAAKTRLFAWPQLRHAVINLDDPMSGAMITAAHLRKANLWRYSSSGDPDAEMTITGVDSNVHETRFTVRTPQGNGEVRTALLGEFNRANVLGVLGVLLAQEVPLSEALQCLSRLTPPPGRLQRLGREGQPVVVIDYAHTPDALDNVLRTLRATQTEGQQLFCVFGCGGDRDPGKRPVMGAIAAKQADRVWITNDNPRSESPTLILKAIEEGLRSVDGASWSVEADRAAAIAQAIAAARAGDLVLIAGKGHEPYQEIAGERHPFLDADAAARALNGWSRK